MTLPAATGQRKLGIPKKGPIFLNYVKLILSVGLHANLNRVY